MSGISPSGMLSQKIGKPNDLKVLENTINPCQSRNTGYWVDKGNNKITELRTILQRESQNS